MPIEIRVAKRRYCGRPGDMGKETYIGGGSFSKYDKHEFGVSG